MTEISFFLLLIVLFILFLLDHLLCCCAEAEDQVETVEVDCGKQRQQDRPEVKDRSCFDRVVVGEEHEENTEYGIEHCHEVRALTHENTTFRKLRHRIDGEYDDSVVKDMDGDRSNDPARLDEDEREDETHRDID